MSEMQNYKLIQLAQKSRCVLLKPVDGTELEDCGATIS